MLQVRRVLVGGDTLPVVPPILQTAAREDSPWFESLEGGIDYLRSVIVDDALGIARGHNGSITVDSEVGRGSEFVIWLPKESAHG